MSKKTKKPSIDRKYLLFGLRIAGDFGASIAIPVVALVSLAQWYQNNHDGSPWYTMAAFIAAGMISGFIIYKKSKKYGKEFDLLSVDQDKKKD